MTNLTVRTDLTRFLDKAALTLVKGKTTNTKRAYLLHWDQFRDWWQGHPGESMLDTLLDYVEYMVDVQDFAPRTIGSKLAAVKGVFRTAAALNPDLSRYLPQMDLVRGPTVSGAIQGQRLDPKQTRALLNAPGTETPKGIRDTAILSSMAIMAMRRSELCMLTWGHLQTLDGYPVIANLKSKHGHVRTIKLPDWLSDLFQLWRVDLTEARQRVLEDDERVFIPIAKGGRIVVEAESMTPQAIYKLVSHPGYGYVAKCGLPSIKPHDLRRTAALLARRGGASIEQVQILLGHASPHTTSNYIGEVLDLTDHAIDYIPVRPGG